MVCTTQTRPLKHKCIKVESIPLKNNDITKDENLQSYSLRIKYAMAKAMAEPKSFHKMHSKKIWMRL